MFAAFWRTICNKEPQTSNSSYRIMWRLATYQEELSLPIYILCLFLMSSNVMLERKTFYIWISFVRTKYIVAPEETHPRDSVRHYSEQDLKRRKNTLMWIMAQMNHCFRERSLWSPGCTAQAPLTAEYLVLVALQLLFTETSDRLGWLQKILMMLWVSCDIRRLEISFVYEICFAQDLSKELNRSGCPVDRLGLVERTIILDFSLVPKP